MDVKVFKTFLEVTKTRHFGKAAANLFITQAAVSARIKQLEEFIDKPLFERTRNNIQLTPAGDRLIPYAETMVRALQQAKTGASLAEVELTQLSFAATPNVWDAYLQNYLTVVTDALPSLAFKTEMSGYTQLCASIMDSTLDLALMFDPFMTIEVSSEKIAEIDLMLVSTSQQLSIDSAFDKGYVYVDWGTQFASEHAAKYGENHLPVLHTSTGRIALDFILAKGGSTYLPKSLAAPFIESDQLFPVIGQHKMTRSIYAIYRKDNVTRDAVKQVVKVIDQSSPQRPVILETVANTETS